MSWCLTVQLILLVRVPRRRDQSEMLMCDDVRSPAAPRRESRRERDGDRPESAVTESPRPLIRLKGRTRKRLDNTTPHSQLVAQAGSDEDARLAWSAEWCVRGGA